MSNGCHVYNVDGEIISGTDYLIDDPISQQYCQTDYPLFHGTLFLPFTNIDTSIVVVLNNFKLIDAPFYIASDSLFILRISVDSSGNYYLKNKSSVSTGNKKAGRLTAIPADTPGEAWVIGLDLLNDNLAAYRINFTGELVETIISPSAPLPPVNTSAQHVFSPDKTKYAFIVENEGIRLYDFDAESGELDNLRIISLPDSARYSRGIQFSPNSEFIYTTHSIRLYQVEIATEEVILIAERESRDETGWPIAMGTMQTGPDCRIYVSPSSTTNYIHVIHSPNEKGLACDFEYRAVRTPTRLAFQIPNMPMTLDPDDCKDLPWILTPPVSNESLTLYLLPVTVSPNPAVGELSVSWPTTAENGSYTWRLYTIEGRLMREFPVLNGENFRLDRRGVRADMYIWELLEDGRRVGTGKVVLK